MAKNIISFRNFTKRYGKLTAVDNFNLEIKKGEFFGLLGPNGAGKTTTIGCLFGLNNITEGKIEVNDLDSVKDYKKVHKMMGLAPQEENLDFWVLDVRGILIYNAGYFGIPKKEAEKRADELLKFMDLWEKRHDKVMMLSGGMKRRLLLARAIVHDPDVIVMDEPTAGADVELRKKLWKYIKKLNEEGKTIILTTHYLEEAEVLCDRVAIMDKGKILKIGKVSDLKKEGSSLEKVYLKYVEEGNNE